MGIVNRELAVCQIRRPGVKYIHVDETVTKNRACVGSGPVYFGDAAGLAHSDISVLSGRRQVV